MNISSLFQEFNYKNLHLKNRFVMAPMTRAKATDGEPNQDIVDYYARRAGAGVGLILSEGTVINRPSAKNMKDIPNFHGYSSLKGWEKVISAVHENGGAMGPQIWHVGNTPTPGWAPPAPFESPDEMTIESIQSTIFAFAQAAKDAKDLGFDCFEIHGAHGYLIDQFFWEGTNHRTDEYGGATIKERSRFAIDVVKAMRAAVGKDFTIILRISQFKQQDYTARLATNPAEMETWLVPLAEAGVDIFHCSQRRFWEPEFEGSDLNFAGWAKKITGQPTITVGSIGLSGDMTSAFQGQDSDVRDLDELLRRFERGDFDLVAVGRALLGDYQWVEKIKNSRAADLKKFEAKSLAVLY